MISRVVIAAVIGTAALSAASARAQVSAEGDAPSASATADSLSANRYVRISLLLEAEELSPGSTTTLAVAFDLDPDWHLYWRNPGDSGLAPNVEFSVPPGVEIGDPTWPVPERMLAPGDILDYVYGHQLTLLYPLRVQPEVTGPNVTIQAEIEFLACRDLCIPGKQQVSATWPVHSAESTDVEESGDTYAEFQATPLDPAAKRARFAETRARLPRPAPAGAVISRWNGLTLDLHVAGASGLTFFPYESDKWIYPEAMGATGTAQGDRLRLTWPEEVKDLSSVQGVLEIHRSGKPEFLELNLAVPR